MVYYLDTMSSFASSRLIVGSPEWLASKNYTHPKTVSMYECDSASIPKQKVSRPAQYAKLKKLQSKMMDNGWVLIDKLKIVNCGVKIKWRIMGGC